MNEFISPPVLTLVDLPHDVLEIILQQLPKRDVIVSKRVCKKLHQAINERELWTRLMSFAQIDFNQQTALSLQDIFLKSEWAYELAVALLKQCQDARAAARLLKMSAEYGHPRAMLEWGMALVNGYYFVPMDKERGNEYILRAVEAGDLLALARCVRDGVGSIPEDKERFISILMSLDNTDPWVQSFIGAAYRYGDGVVLNNALAVVWLEKAAAQGQCYAQGLLGSLLSIDTVIAHDFPRAISLLQKSSDQGCVRAKLHLGFLYNTGRGVETSESTAFRYFEEAAAQNCDEAMVNLGVHLLNGKGVEPNPERAMQLFRQAARLGNGTAKEILEALGENES